MKLLPVRAGIFKR